MKGSLFRVQKTKHKNLKGEQNKINYGMNLTKHLICFGDAAKVLRTFPDETFQLMVTSPPYWNVRDYGVKEQIGYYDTLEQYLDRLDEVWAEVVRTLLPDGKIALNIGNIYYSEADENKKTNCYIITFLLEFHLAFNYNLLLSFRKNL